MYFWTELDALKSVKYVSAARINHVRAGSRSARRCRPLLNLSYISMTYRINLFGKALYPKISAQPE